MIKAPIKASQYLNLTINLLIVRFILFLDFILKDKGVEIAKNRIFRILN